MLIISEDTKNALLLRIISMESSEKNCSESRMSRGFSMDRARCGTGPVELTLGLVQWFLTWGTP